MDFFPLQYFPEFWGEEKNQHLQGLSQENNVNIRYLIIEIFIYFHVKESSEVP